MNTAEKYIQGLLEIIPDSQKQQLSYASGASKTDLLNLQTAYPLCPPSLLQMLSIINGTYFAQYGEHKICVYLLGSDVEDGGYPYYLKSVEQILTENKRGESIQDIYGDYLDNKELVDVDAGIDTDIIMDHRLCFSDCMNNGGTSQLYIDFNPTAIGTVGQVVRFLHDPDSFKIIANSFDEYLQMLMEKKYPFTELMWDEE